MCRYTPSVLQAAVQSVRRKNNVAHLWFMSRDNVNTLGEREDVHDGWMRGGVSRRRLSSVHVYGSPAEICGSPATRTPLEVLKVRQTCSQVVLKQNNKKRCSMIIKKHTERECYFTLSHQTFVSCHSVRLNILYWTFQIPQFILYVYFFINLASIFVLLILVFCVTAVTHKHNRLILSHHPLCSAVTQRFWSQTAQFDVWSFSLVCFYDEMFADES